MVGSKSGRISSGSPGFDYISFTLTAPVTNFNFTQGTEIPLFSFENGSGCLQLELIDNASDPFLPPNLLNVDISNSFTILGAGVNQNAYEGNSSEFAAACLDLDLSISADSNPVKCHGDHTRLTVEAIGGKEPYIVQWSHPLSGNSGTGIIPDFNGSWSVDDLSPGSYSISITDQLDSTRQVIYNILEPDPIDVVVSSFPASCNGSMDGSAFIEDVDGGTIQSDYQYFWNTNPTVSSPSIGFLDPGVYTVTVVDDNGCQLEKEVTVGAFTLIIILNEVVKDVSCYGERDGFIDIYPFSTTAPFTFDWSSNANAGNQSSAEDLGPGDYTVTITDGTGVCFIVDTFSVAEPLPISTDYTLINPRCYGEKGILKEIQVQNAIEPVDISIIGESTRIGPNEFEVEPGLPSRLVIEDANGCTVSEDFLIPAQQEMIVQLGESQTIKYGQEISFDPLIFPLDDVSIEWIPGDELSCNDCPDPVARPTESTTYVLKVTNASGCTMEDHVAIQVVKSRDIYIPNAFSPNFDGVNDLFCPLGGFEVVRIRSMYVFDRWGGLLYSNEKGFDLSEPKTGWDGTTAGKLANTGTYLYSMNVEFIDGETVLFSGEINLLR